MDDERPRFASEPLPILRPAWGDIDVEWYRATYAYDLGGTGHDVGAVDGDAIRQYYYEAGVRRRHSPNPFFDEAYYLDANPDVAEAVAAGAFSSGFEHYGLDGHKSRSPHWLFSESHYLARNIDLTRDRLIAGGYANGYDHYLKTGDAESRIGHWLFDPVMHQAAIADHREDHTVVGEFHGFVLGDRRVGSTHRLSWYFDPAWYLSSYPEVAAEIGAGQWSCALEHYLRNAAPSRFDPNAYFDEAYYRSVHIDLGPAFEQGRFRNAFDHFLQYGAHERRKPHAMIDLHEHYRPVDVQTAINQGHVANVFTHFVMAQHSAWVPGAGLAADQGALDEGDAKRLYAIACRNLLPTLARHAIDFRPVVPTATPTLSVIIVAFNRFELTLATLASLRANIAADLQVLLVDSGSRDEVGDIERYVTGLDIIKFRQNVGFIDGCNAALARVRATTTLFLNNDVQLDPGAIALAMARLWNERPVGGAPAGAVGAKIIRSHGRLQEAGSIIWSDGNASGYLRDADPTAPEANFVRPVDYCSAAFLLCRTDLLRRLDGFDAAYRPAYFEEADLCVRMRALGYATIYDPAVQIRHYEFATTDPTISDRMVGRNQPIFLRKNETFLRGQHARGRPGDEPARLALARTAAQAGLAGHRILFIDDRLPFRHLGSGFTRSNDIVHTLADLGHQVTVFPIYKATETLAEIYREFPDTVEVIFDRDLPDLDAFLTARAGCFEAIWIARTHNAERLLPILLAQIRCIPAGRLILDTEAVAAMRTVRRNRLAGCFVAAGGETEADMLQRLVEDEIAPGFVCQRIVAVSLTDAGLIHAAALRSRAGSVDIPVEVLGHVQSLDRPCGPGWAERHGLLFLGSIHAEDSPNRDGLTWFTSDVLPLLDSTLPPRSIEPGACFAVAGMIGPGVSLGALGQNPRVDLLGRVADLDALYARYRVFVAPTRFAAGIPYKLHEAAAYGVPIVATSLLCEQLNWTPDVDLLVADIDDPRGFADAVMRLYRDEALWNTIRENALARIAAENGPTDYAERLSGILSRVFA